VEQPPSTQYNVRIREIPASDRPRERLRDLGPSGLTTAELLAIVLRTGSGHQNVITLAQNLLRKHNGLAGLARLSFSDLLNEKGVGEAKAAELVATFHLAALLQKIGPQDRLTIHTPADVSMLLGVEMAFLDQEHLKVVLVSSRNQVMAIKDVYKGSVSSALVRVAELFQEAIRQNAPSIVLVHNHPSGDPTPSPDDVALTKQAVEAGQLLNIEVLDHIVIGDGGKYFSLKKVGLGGLTAG
jgi:DNA repair protein RadC